MTTLKFYGASDNIILAGPLEDVKQFDKGTCNQCEAHVGRFLVKADGEAICIHAVYAGSWAFAITSENAHTDFETMPNWAIRRTFGVDTPYSETLEIDVPDNAELRFLDDE